VSIAWEDLLAGSYANRFRVVGYGRMKPTKILSLPCYQGKNITSSALPSHGGRGEEDPVSAVRAKFGNNPSPIGAFPAIANEEVGVKIFLSD
jgi:hypothetical protein